MGAPSPELCNLWLARASNAHDVDAAAAMYHPDASVVQVDGVHRSMGYAVGRAPCLTADFGRSFIFGTNGTAH